MPNRILKESICTSDNLNELTEEEENFFYRLLVCCDDFGRFDGRPLIIKSRCYPLRDKSTESIKNHLQKLQAAKIITLYVVDDKEYIQMTTWDKHQQVRAKKSKYPAPANCPISSDINCNQTPANVPVIQSNPIQSESSSDETKKPMMTRGEFVSLYEQTFGKLMPGGLNTDCDRMCAAYTPERIRDAFRSATDNQANSFAYIRTVLTNKREEKAAVPQVDIAAIRAAEIAELRAKGIEI